MEQDKLPPSLAGWELTKTLLQIVFGSADFLSVNEKIFKKSDGKFGYSKVGNEYSYVFFHPRQIRYILKENPDNFPKQSITHCPSIFRNFKHIMGEGLITSVGQSWKQQNKILAPQFLGKIIYSFQGLLHKAIDQTVQTLQEKALKNELFNLQSVLRKLAINMMGYLTLGCDLDNESDDIKNAVDDCNKFICRKLTSVGMPLWFPTPLNIKMRAVNKLMTKIVHRHYQKRKRNGDSLNDVLGILMQATEDNGAPLSFQQIRDQIVTIIIAGHEATVSALTWCMYLIATHTYWEEKLISEWNFEGVSPTYSESENFTFTKMAVQETLRLYPAVFSIARTCKDGDSIDGYKIMKDSNIYLSLYHIHRHPEYWENPDQFNPERFNPSQVDKIDKFSYLPFGFGPHTCIGRQLSMFEMMIAVPAILRRFRIKVSNSAKIQKECLVNIRPKNGVEVLLEPRSI